VSLQRHGVKAFIWLRQFFGVIKGGHIHLPYVLPLHDLARPMWAVQAGTAVSSRVRSGVPNSVNLLRWGEGAPGGCCQIERWDFSVAERSFVRVTVSEVRPARVRSFTLV
jgi:hypothetical protein